MSMTTSVRAAVVAALPLAAVLAGSPAQAALVHRYSFTNDASDSVGSANGTLEGNAAISNGQAVLSADGDYVNLPGPTIAINSYAAITLEAWVTGDPTNIGKNDMTVAFGHTGAASDEAGTDYLIFNTLGTSGSGVTISNSDWHNESKVLVTPAWNDNQEHQVVVTVGSSSLSLYIDGVLQGTTGFTHGQSLAQLSNDDAYLGRSVYPADSPWIGSFDEFRIYNSALDMSRVEADFKAGPNTVVVPEPASLVLLGVGILVLMYRRVRGRCGA